MEQRKDEWLKLNNIEWDYHRKQFETPYRSTVAFCDWLTSLNIISRESKLNILDIGAGAGGNIYYMNKLYPSCSYKGIDLNHALIQFGNSLFEENKLANCSLEFADLYNLNPKFSNTYNGIVSYQTLSWLPEYERALQAMAKLNPEWIALTSLFYEGKVNCRIEIQDYSYNETPGQSFKESFYNIYSLPLIQQLFNSYGYGKFHFKKFEIDIDLPKTSSGMGTYTEKLINGSRIQISGPVLMNWYFIVASK